MQVKLKGISKRGKDRINSHGHIFDVVTEPLDVFTGESTKMILVRSLNNTWRGEKWLGWFEIDKEAKIID